MSFAADNQAVRDYMATPYFNGLGESFKAWVRHSLTASEQAASACKQEGHAYLWPLAERQMAAVRVLCDASAALPPAGGALVESVVPMPPA